MSNQNKHKIEFEQRSPEWLDFRKTRIGGSDAAIICGLSPWSTVDQLYGEKSGVIPKKEFTSNWAIDRGVRLEPVVCGMVNIIMDRDFMPVTYARADPNYIMASLDGYDEGHCEAIEIKVGNRKDHDHLADYKESTPQLIIVPKKYYPQMQQQMFVMDLEHIFYCSYYLSKGTPEGNGNLKIVKVLRDENFLSQYLAAAAEFMECIRELRPPGRFNISL